MYLGDLSFKEAKAKINNKLAESKDFFYDWFCTERSLNKRAQDLLKRAQYIIDKCEISEEKIKIFFTNCCPLEGELFDRFYIASTEYKDKWICITPKYGHCHEALYKKCELYFNESDKEILFNNYKEFKRCVQVMRIMIRTRLGVQK